MNWYASGTAQHSKCCSKRLWVLRHFDKDLVSFLLAMEATIALRNEKKQRGSEIKLIFL